MTNHDAASHNQRIIEAFTTQAIPFGKMHSDEESMRLLFETAAITPHDDLLDVACGPGVVGVAAAPYAKHVTGIDLTPAMIEEARRRADAANIGNTTWKVGDVENLPFADEQFSIVLCRFALHHMLQPQIVLQEMGRVCRRGGRVVIADMVVTSAAQGQLLDAMEVVRDPSHVHALQPTELAGMFSQAGVRVTHQHFFRVPVEVDTLLTMTGTSADNADRVRDMVRADLGHNAMGIEATENAGVLGFSFPIIVLGGVRE